MKRAFLFVLSVISFVTAFQLPAFAQSEIELVLPDLNQATFFGGIPARSLLAGGLVICALGSDFRSDHLQAAAEHARALVDVGDFGADL